MLLKRDINGARNILLNNFYIKKKDLACVLKQQSRQLNKTTMIIIIRIFVKNITITCMNKKYLDLI